VDILCWSSFLECGGDSFLYWKRIGLHTHARNIEIVEFRFGQTSVGIEDLVEGLRTDHGYVISDYGCQELSKLTRKLQSEAVMVGLVSQC